VFAAFAFACTACFCLFDGMTWAEWLDYNKWIGAGFLGAKAVEGGAAAIKGKVGGQE